MTPHSARSFLFQVLFAVFSESRNRHVLTAEYASSGSSVSATAISMGHGPPPPAVDYYGSEFSVIRVYPVATQYFQRLFRKDVGIHLARGAWQLTSDRPYRGRTTRTLLPAEGWRCNTLCSCRAPRSLPSRRRSTRNRICRCCPLYDARRTTRE